MNSQKSQNHFRNFRDIWNYKAENNACNCISGVDRHRKCKADVRHCEKNACDYSKSIVTRISNCTHTKSAARKNSPTIPPISITNIYMADTVKTMER